MADAVWFLTRARARFTPTRPRSSRPTLDEFAAALRDEPDALVVWFDATRRVPRFGIQELMEVVPLEPLARVPGGRVYRLRSASPRPRAPAGPPS